MKSTTLALVVLLALASLAFGVNNSTSESQTRPTWRPHSTHAHRTTEGFKVRTQAIVALVILIVVLLSIITVLVCSYTEGKCGGASHSMDEAAPMLHASSGAKFHKPTSVASLTSNATAKTMATGKLKGKRVGSKPAVDKSIIKPSASGAGGKSRAGSSNVKSRNSKAGSKSMV